MRWIKEDVWWKTRKYDAYVDALQYKYVEGIEQGIEQGIEKGIEKGREEEIIAKQKVIQLMGLLAEHGRIDDIKKSSTDQEYLQSLLLEFGL